MARWFAILPGAIALASVGLSQDPGGPAIKFERDIRENVVASRLAGTWQLDSELTRRMGGFETRSLQELTFHLDWSVIPDEVFDKLGERLGGISLTIYAAGLATVGGQDKPVPFFLTAVYGTPRIVWFRERNGDPFGDMESFNLMVAVGRERKDDLLFRGGDFNNQPFTAYKRTK